MATSSPFSQTLLRKNKHAHTVIYMRGVKSEDLVAILDFIYFGEANVSQDYITDCLALAKELKLKGLTGNVKHEQAEETDQVDTKNMDLNLQPKNEQLQPCESFNELTNGETKEMKTSVTLSNFEVSNVIITSLEELDEQVKSMMNKSQSVLSNGRKADLCTMFGKEGLGRNIKDHIESNHLEGVSLPCNFCEKFFRCRNGIWTFKFIYYTVLHKH